MKTILMHLGRILGHQCISKLRSATCSHFLTVSQKEEPKCLCNPTTQFSSRVGDGTCSGLEPCTWSKTFLVRHSLTPHQGLPQLLCLRRLVASMPRKKHICWNYLMSSTQCGIAGKNNDQPKAKPSAKQQYLNTSHESGFLKRALAQTCLRAWYQVRFFRSIFGHSRGLAQGEGGAPGTVPLHDLSTFTCSSPRCAPWVVPSTFLLNYVWAFLGGLARGEGRPWYGTFAKPTGHFTEEKC